MAGIQDEEVVLSSLGILPYELLVNILQLLTWKDVLRTRLTCKRLAEVTQTKTIWLHLITSHIIDNPQRAFLERPIELYTSSELERRFLFWKSAEVGWDLKKKRGKPSWTRTFRTARPAFMHLIKGGRWLLVTDESCAVSYYDLDSKTGNAASLITPPGSRNYINFTMSIDINDQSPFLTFRVAFSLLDGAPSNSVESFYRLSVQVWEVSLTLDASKHAVGLKATRLASFPHRPGVIGVGSISLLGEHLAIRANIAESSYAIVINWKQAKKYPKTYQWRVAQPTGFQADLQLLPDNKLLIATSLLKVSDYSMIPESSCVPDTDQNFPASWQYQSRSGRVLYVSDPFLFETHTSCLWNSSDSLWKIDIPRATSLDGEQVLPAVTRLADFPSPSQHYKPLMGYTLMVVTDPTVTNRMTVIRYSHLDGNSSKRSLNLTRISGLTETHIVVDEASGCVAYYSPTEPYTLSVADFALISRS